MNPLRGCGTALVTPFNNDGSIDETALRALVDWQIEQGIHFLVPCGSTGEAATMTIDEHKRVVQVTIEQAKGRVPVVAGAASNDTAKAVSLSKAMKELGATPADVGQGDVPWTVLADPEGNVFCVLEPREIYRDTGPIAAVVVDCADPRAMARFWGEATDWTLHEVTDDHARLRSAKGVGPYLEFLRAPGVRTWWNRFHLDLAPYPGDDQAAEVARLRALGATSADVGQGDVPWTVLADPEGNQFCVLGRG